MRTHILTIVGSLALLSGCNKSHTTASHDTSRDPMTPTREPEGMQSGTPDSATYQPSQSTGQTYAPSDHASMDDHRSTTNDHRSGKVYGTNEPSSPEASILSFMHTTNQAEIRVGQLAQTSGASDAVRAYGRMLVRDHTDSDAKVRDAARAARIPVTEDTSNADPDLAGLSGTEFDHAFAMKMVEGHKAAIERVQAARDTVKDPEIRKLLDSTLPTLREHLRQAEALR